jgi:gliding motility-associated-like protein
VNQTLSETVVLVGTTEVYAVIATDSICIPSAITFNGTTNGNSYYWILPDGTLSSELNPTSTLTNSGIQNAWFISELEGSCNGVDSAHITVTGFEPLSNVDWIIEELSDECLLTKEVIGAYTGQNETDLLWDDGNGNSSANSNVVFSYNVPGTYTIQLEVINEICDQGELLQYSVEIPNPSSGPLAMIIPNIFTPNDDPLNTIWKPQTDETQFLKWSLKIFSRWGEMIFESTDPNLGWNGNILSEKASEGTYYFTLEFTPLCNLGSSQNRSGYFQLIR